MIFANIWGRGWISTLHKFQPNKVLATLVFGLLGSGGHRDGGSVCFGFSGLVSVFE